VNTAGDRTREVTERAWLVLGDPGTRECYDHWRGLRTTGGGLLAPSAMPAEPPLNTTQPGGVLSVRSTGSPACSRRTRGCQGR